MRQTEMTETELTFRKNIVWLRLYHHYRISDVAKKTGINASSYSHLERLQYSVKPSFSVFEKLANLYNIKVTDLFIPQWENGDLLLPPHDEI